MPEANRTACVAMDAVTALNLALALFNIVVICIVAFILVTAKQNKVFRQRTRNRDTPGAAGPDLDYDVSHSRDMSTGLCF